MTHQRPRMRPKPSARGFRRRCALVSAALGIAAAATLVGATTVAASPADAASCSPISPTQLRSILGLDSSLQMRNTVSPGEALRYECNAVAWSGPTPPSLDAAFQTARSGRGAQFGIETYRPNEGSPDVQRWRNRDYAKLTGGFDTEAATFPGLFTNAGWPAKRFSPSSLGYQTKGFVVRPQGKAKGLIVAAGCWWDDKSYSAACLLVEEAIGKPVVKHLNQLAKIAVPNVLR